jgi:hypothetical protein
MYNLEVIQESKLLMKAKTTNQTYEDIKQSQMLLNLAKRNSSLVNSKVPSSPDKEGSLQSSHKDNSDIEYDSFCSDDSYYDENENFELACIN